jgi:CHAT domain-containing protein/ankyrin repeat protein
MLSVQSKSNFVILLLVFVCILLQAPETYAQSDELEPIYQLVVDDDIAGLEAAVKTNNQLLESDFSGGNNLLHVAAYYGSEKIVDYLLKQGLDINSRNQLGQTPLHYATMQDRVTIVVKLLSNGAKLDIEDNEGVVAKSLAESDRSYHFLSEPNKLNELIVLYELDAMSFDDTYKATANELFAKNPSLKNSRFLDGGTLMHRKAAQSEYQVLPILFQMGIGVNQLDEQGRTALMVAAQSADSETVTQLLALDAEYSIIDANGFSAIDHAMDNWNSEVKETLRAHIVKLMPKMEPLRDAILNDQSNKVIKLIKKNSFDFNFKVFEGYSFVMLAVNQGMVEVVQMMAEKGANLDSKVEIYGQYYNAFSVAIKNSDQPMLTKLVALKPDYLNDQETILAEILKTNEPETFTLLLNKGFSTAENPIDYESWRLTEAVEAFLQQEKANTELYRLMLKNFPILFNDKENNQVDVFRLIEFNQPPLLTVALASKPNLSIVNDKGVSPLIAALHQSNQELALLLLDYDASLLTSQSVTESPILLAIRLGRDKVVAKVPGSSPAFRQVDKQGLTPAHRMLKDKRYDSLLTLIKSGLDINLKDRDSNSLLIQAVTDRDHPAVKLLLKAGASTAEKDKAGNTGLMLSVLNSDIKIFQLLLDDSFVDETNNVGQQAIHFAARSGNFRILEELLDNDANIGHYDADYLLPWHYAFSQGHHKLLTELVERIPEPTACIDDCLFEDPLIQYINALYLAGESQKAIRLIEKHIEKGNQNPLLPAMWVNYHDRGYQLEEHWSKASQAIKQSTSIIASIDLAANDKAKKLLLESYPLSYDFKRRDLMSLVDLATLANQLGSRELHIAYSLRALSIEPNFFQSVWSITSTASLTKELINQIELTISEVPFEKTLAKEYLTQFIKTPSIPRNQQIAMRQQWLSKLPFDARAAVALSYNFDAAYYLDQGLINNIRGMVYSPFYSNYSNIAESHFKMDNPPAAKHYLSHLMKVLRLQESADSDEVQRHLTNVLGDSYHSVGMKQQARIEFNKGIEQWPNDERNYLDLAKIEHNASRHRESLALLDKANDLKPQDQAIQRQIVKLQMALERFPEAQNNLDELIQVHGMNKENYQISYDLASKQSDVDRQKVLATSFSDYGASLTSLIHQLEWNIEQEYFDEFLSQFDKVIRDYYLSNYDAKRVAKLLDKHPDVETASYWQSRISSLVFPEGGHSAYVDVFLSDKKDKVDYWKSLYQLNSSTSFALDKLANLLTSDEDWESYFQLFEKNGDALPSTYVNKADLSSYIVDYVWLVYRQSQKSRVKQERVERSLTWLEDYKENLGSLSQYYRYREYMFSASQQKEMAAHSLLERSRLLKDSTSIFHDLISLYSAENRNAGFLYGSQMLKRNPYSSSHSQSFMHKHVMWGGSPIAVLREIDRVKRLSIADVKYSNYEKRALGSLGDTLTAYQGYKAYSGINSSQRYVDWFNTARKNALFKQGKTINYDFNDDYNEVQIIDHDGFIKVRRDHPIYGKLTFAKSGASWVEVGYTDRGDMSSLRTSNGRFVELTYNNENKITQMVDNVGRSLSFDYNEMGKPVLIEELGVGSVNVSYDKQGDILSVRSDQGHTMALKLTQAFQGLLSLAKIPEGFLRSGTLPRMPGKNDQSASLRNHYDSAKTTKALKPYISYLVDNVQSDRNFYEEARELLDRDIGRLSERFSNGNFSKSNVKELLFAAQSWKSLMGKVKSEGLPLSDYSDWKSTLGLMKNVALTYNNKKVNEFLFDLENDNLGLLNNANWLHQSSFVNEGYWHRYANSVVAKGKSKINPKAILARKNGDLLVGTNKGLMIHDGYFWRQYVYSTSSQSLVASDASNNSDFSVLSLAEVGETLWLGTNNGLFKLVGEYANSMTIYDTQNSPFKSARINALASSNQDLVIANPEGVYRWTSADEKITSILTDIKVSEIVISSSEPNNFMLSTSSGLVLYVNGKLTRQMTDFPVKSAIFLNTNEIWYLRSDHRVYHVDISKPESKARLVVNKNDLTMSKTTHSLILIPWQDGTSVPMVLTDLGLNLYSQNHIQFMELPFKRERQGRRVGAEYANVSPTGDLWMISEEALYGYLPSKVFHMDGKVKTMVSDPELGAVYIAKEDGIFLLDQNAALSSQGLIKRFHSARSNSMALSSEGDLYTNDGFQVLRFRRGDPSPQVLFNARPNVDEEIEKWWRGSVKKILLDSQNTLWVAAGSSLWRWREGEEAKEYNYSLDPESFPSRSQIIFNVYEDTEQVIRVVASNESHLRHNGIPLAGGELIYQGGNFVRAKKPYRKGWFVSGYTPMNNNSAVVATGYEYYRDRNGKRNSFNELASYKALKENAPMLFLGGQGSRFSSDDETWLFPSAGGLMTFHNNRWFYPDRLNQLLPKDAELGQYGGRMINSVQVDNKGRIYAGTDLGLMIYDAKDIESFLISQDQGNWIFVDRDNDHLSSLKNIFVDQIDPKSAQGKLVRRLKTMESEIEKLEFDVSQPEVNVGPTSETSTQSNSSKTDIKSLQKLLSQREKTRQRLLAKLESEHYGLFQMLKLDPREAQQMGKKLADDQVLVQYLPTPKSLFINVIGKKQNSITEVPIGSNQLFSMVKQVSAGLRAKSDLVRGIKVKTTESVNPANLSDNLAYLYDKLIRPIEGQLERKKHVFISPVGQLTYLPFASLIKRSDGKSEYAIERYNMGVIPSLYHLDLVLSHEQSFASNELIAADPDGSLPGARKEISNIKRYLDAPVSLVGNEFSLENLNDALADARIVHLATHGVLDAESPADSYILLANGQRLDIPTIATMDLSQTDLVVLSACETGIGKQGLELATLARAFALSNVPTVVASLWKVDDQSTAKLMTLFYREYQKNRDTVIAFAAAQRKMIKGEKVYSHPSDWSAFNVIGKP